jgi:hypothetical protein
MATCASQGCTKDTSGKSKYCAEHKAIARQKWLDNVRKSGEEREANKKRFAELHAAAHKAGMEAAEAHKPAPMVVQQHTNMLDDSSPVVQSWVVEGGVCGFAWVNVPGNTKFGAWAKKNLGAKKDYPKGLSIWCPLNTQSMTTKEAYCNAYAKVLNEGDPSIKAWSRSRID